MVRTCKGEDRRTCSNENIEVSGQRNIGRQKLTWSDVIGGTRSNKLKKENLMCQPRVGKWPKKNLNRHKNIAVAYYKNCP